MDKEDRSNVIDFNRYRSYALFAPPLRQKLEAGVTAYTDRPAEAVSSVEQIICTHLVAFCREFAVRMGTRAGEKLAGKMLGEK